MLIVQAIRGIFAGDAGHSTRVICARSYTENLLLYVKQTQAEYKLPVPIWADDNFAPVELAMWRRSRRMCLHMRVRRGLRITCAGKLLSPLVSVSYDAVCSCVAETEVDVGPQPTAGPELAEANSQAPATKMEPECTDEYAPPVCPLPCASNSCQTGAAANDREEDP